MSKTAIESTMQALAEANELLAAHAAFILRVRSSQKEHRRKLHALQSPPIELLRLPLIPSPPPSPVLEDSPPPSPPPERVIRPDLPPAKRARAERYPNYIPEEETIRNDYSQRYVDGGEWPQNWVIGAEPEHRFEEYPKQQRLLRLKKASVNEYSLPPLHLPFSELKSLHGSKFDVILIDPPFSSSFTWDHLQEINIPSLAGDPSFVFLWVGSGAGEGLERGREVLAKWGYRRCEDVVWVKTNKTTNKGPGMDPPTTSLLTRTKYHCLMGIRGTVRRSTDSWFVHCNVDTDVIIWEGDPNDATRKPPEMYTLIENFCLGFRRLEVFGKLSSLRRGWVTVLAPGQETYLPSNGAFQVEEEEGGLATRWVQETWEEGIRHLAASSSAASSSTGSITNNAGIPKPVVPMSAEIDSLRPKSPVRGGQHNSNNSMGGGAVSNNSSGSGPQQINTAPRFMNSNVGPGNRVNNGGFTNLPNAQIARQNHLLSQNTMMGQSMMGMNTMGMGMAGMEDYMGAWNPMMGGMGGMGMGGGMGTGSGVIPTRGMTAGGGLPAIAAHNMGMVPGAGNMSSGMGTSQGLNGMPMHMMNQMAGMGNGFAAQGNFNNGMQMFNNSAGWAGDQGQYGMDGWVEGDGSGMVGANIPGMLGGMGMGNMNMAGMGMNQQWGGSGAY